MLIGTSDSKQYLRMAQHSTSQHVTQFWEHSVQSAPGVDYRSLLVPLRPRARKSDTHTSQMFQSRLLLPMPYSMCQHTGTHLCVGLPKSQPLSPGPKSPTTALFARPDLGLGR